MTGQPTPESDRSEPSDHARTQPVNRDRRRSLVAVFLVVVTTLGVVLAPVAWWVRTSVLDTEAFIAIVEPTLASEEVAAAVGDIVAERAIAALDLSARLESRLGQVDQFLGNGLADALDLGPASRRLLGRLDLPQLSRFAGPLASAAEEQIRDATESFVQSNDFQAPLVAAVDKAHRSAVALLRGDIDSLEGVQVVDGEVVWNLVPAIAATIGFLVQERLGGGVLDSLSLPAFAADEDGSGAALRLAEALGVELPDDFGQLTLVSEEQLATWQTWIQVFDRTVWALTIATVLLFVGALAVSPQRRRTLVQLAIGGVVGVVLVLLVQRGITDAIRAAISDPTQSEAFRVVAEEMVSGLRRIVLAVAAVGVVIGLSAHVLGRPAWQENFSLSARRLLSGGSGSNRFELVMSRHRDAFTAGGIVAALAFWAVFGIGLLSFLIVGLLLGFYLSYVMIAGGRSDDTSDPKTMATSR